MTPDEALEAAYNEIAAANPDQKYEPFKKDYISYQVSIRSLELYSMALFFDYDSMLETENIKLTELLWKYVRAQSRMLHDWAEGDDLIKKALWKNLHSLENEARELLDKIKQQEG